MKQIALEGLVWDVSDTIADELRAWPRAYVLACEECRALCSIASDCACCAKIGKSFGGKRVKGIQSQHVAFAIADVRTALRSAA